MGGVNYSGTHTWRSWRALILWSGSWATSFRAGSSLLR